MDADSLMKKIVTRDLTPMRSGGGGDRTRFVCGYMACDPLLCAPILEGLPPMFKVSVRTDRAGQWLEGSLMNLVEEASSHRAGSDAMLAKVSDGAFVLLALLFGAFDVIVALSQLGTWTSLGELMALSVLGVSAISVLAVGLRRRFCIPALVVVATATLAVTAVAIVTSTSVAPSFAALFALALLAAHALHVEPGGPAVAATGLAAIAVLGEPARIQGAGTIVLPGVTIGDNAVIGAGSLVTTDIPSDCLAYGQPCRVQRMLGATDDQQHDR